MTSRDSDPWHIDNITSAVRDLSTTDVEARLYRGLPSNKHIRLLSLASEAVEDGEILRCEFIEQDITKVIPWAGYNALSYVWGTSPERVAIICCGRQVFITRNLQSALKQIWSITPRQVLWADAICINQDDDEEKGQQVGMMGEIYKAATTVLVWLGEQDARIEALWKGVELDAINLQESLHNREGARIQSELGYFLQHDWFTRAWTLQEVLLARKAVLLCGSNWIDWRLFVETTPAGAQRPIGGWPMKGMDPLISLIKCTEIMHLDSNRVVGNHLKELLLASSTREASDTRDKIYSLLGLLTNTSVNIRPDYTVSRRQLTESFVREQIWRYGDVWALHGCGLGDSATKSFHELESKAELDSAWASWIPNILDPAVLSTVAARSDFPDFSGATFKRAGHVEIGRPPDLLQAWMQLELQFGAGTLRLECLPIGICETSDAVGSGCDVRELPTCLMDLHSKDGTTGTVKFNLVTRRLNWGKAFPAVSVCQIESIIVDIRSPPKLDSDEGPAPFYTIDLAHDMAYHSAGNCACKSRLRRFARLARAKHSLPYNCHSQHKTKPGDLLCALSEQDGLFFLRPHSKRKGLFELVGSAFGVIPTEKIKHRDDWDEIRTFFSWSTFPHTLQINLC